MVFSVGKVEIWSLKEDGVDMNLHWVRIRVLNGVNVMDTNYAYRRKSRLNIAWTQWLSQKGQHPRVKFD